MNTLFNMHQNILLMSTSDASDFNGNLNGIFASGAEAPEKLGPPSSSSPPPPPAADEADTAEDLKPF